MLFYERVEQIRKLEKNSAKIKFTDVQIVLNVSTSSASIKYYYKKLPNIIKTHQAAPASGVFQKISWLLIYKLTQSSTL